MDGQMDRSAKFNLVATYENPDKARAALQALERKGVEAADIELFGPGIASGKRPVTNDEQQAIDMRSTAAVGKRFTAVSAALAVVGAIVGGVLGAVVSDGYGGGILAGVLGGFIVGGLLGFLWGGYGSLPANEQFADTFQSDGGETSLAVHADDETVIDLARETLAGSDARRLEVV
jgi:outer membrane lipoprotein SlyB